MDLSRQVRLAEVGEAGQARIASHEFALPEGDELAREYARRAGALRLVADEREDAGPHAGTFAFDAARAVGTSAWRALRELRRALAAGGA